MTEDEFRRGRSTDLLARLELIHEALTAVAEAVDADLAPADEAGRDRCFLVADSIARKGMNISIRVLRRPPGAEHDRILAEARDREQGEEP